MVRALAGTTSNPDCPNLNFVLWRLPAHIHLLCGHEEICTWCRQAGYGDDFSTYGGNFLLRVVK